MGFYRKKPTVIEARQLTIENADELADWSGGSAYIIEADGEPVDTVVEIPTLEGLMTASNGDFIIKGVQGEFYPCKPDIFEQTYEPVKYNKGGVIESATINITMEEVLSPEEVRNYGQRVVQELHDRASRS